MRLIELLITVQVKRLLLTILLLLSGTQAAIAYTNFCKPDNGTYNYRYEFGMLTVVDPKGNKPGYLFPRPYQWDLGGNFSGTCDCDPEPETEPDHIADNTYFSTATILPQGHTDGSRNFFIINEYLEAATEIWISGARKAYFPTPWFNESNEYASLGYKTASTNTARCYNPDLPTSKYQTWSTGSKGKLWVYITKPFVGSIFVENTKIQDVYASMNPGSYGGTPMSSIWINGQITVPQNCIIDAGQLITVDFGKIWSGDFTTKGQKLVGYTEKKIKASMKCNNIAAYTNLTLRFQSEVSPDDSTFIKTDNADVGVELLDENGKLVLPNNGLMPFTINENYEASVSFQVAPVSTTGNVPTAGQFKALAYIRVDFA